MIDNTGRTSTRHADHIRPHQSRQHQQQPDQLRSQGSSGPILLFGELSWSPFPYLSGCGGHRDPQSDSRRGLRATPYLSSSRRCLGNSSARLSWKVELEAVAHQDIVAVEYHALTVPTVEDSYH